MRWFISHVSGFLTLCACLWNSKASPIWRCPEFKLTPCKSIPTTCSSYRMLYIRHVYLECPACLFCADPVVVKPWAMFQAPAIKKTSKRRKRGRLEREREQAKRAELRHKKELVREERMGQRQKKEEDRAERRRLRKLRKLRTKHKRNELT